MLVWLLALGIFLATDTGRMIFDLLDEGPKRVEEVAAATGASASCGDSDASLTGPGPSESGSSGRSGTKSRRSFGLSPRMAEAGASSRSATCWT